MRVRDWFADHFGGQYAVPRVKAKEPSRWWGYGRDFVRVTLKLSLASLIFAVWLIHTSSAKNGRMPVEVLLLAALLAALSGMMFTFLI